MRSSSEREIDVGMKEVLKGRFGGRNGISVIFGGKEFN